MNVIAQGQADLNTLCPSKILSTMISNHKYLCRTFGYYTKSYFVETNLHTKFATHIRLMKVKRRRFKKARP